jgi:hypothetical protein
MPDPHLSWASARFSMPMLMVHVRDMRMPVPHSRMSMGMGVGLVEWIARQVLMLVMLIVHVGVGVLHGLMIVLVLVVLGQV